MRIEVNNANNGLREIVYPELSYKIIGASFGIFNHLGWGFSEIDYQLALVEEFKKRGIEFKREVCIPIRYNSRNIRRYFADFIVENKILLELKVVSTGIYTC